MHVSRIVASCIVLGAVWTPAAVSEPLGDYIVLSWNDLGMHCMNRDHDQISILPPYNDLDAQVILRGNATTLPVLVTQGVTLEYSVPGNTYSVGKTDFWTYAPALFGVSLAPNVGLTGLGLSGVFTLHGTRYEAVGIPVTPFTDAAPTVEDPYQQALVIVRDGNGMELARSNPVIPVSTEVNCVSSGCHSSITSILRNHDDEGGFNANNTPILCASCHGSPPLTGVGQGSAGYFSRRIHEKHSFLDNQLPGIDGCQKCHPGPVTQCLRGTMATDFGLVCQNCHGTMDQMKNSIENGRIPWLQEPACRTCHTAQYGEPVGQLYRESTGHGGVQCAACHGSPHAIFPSREPRDNANMVALQGHAGMLSDCTVCHGVTPNGPGPHGLVVTGVVENEITGGARGLGMFPNPVRRSAAVEINLENANPEDGRLLVFDAQGRTVRLLQVEQAAGGVRARWDGRDGTGSPVATGVYFVQWRDPAGVAAGKLLVVK